MSDASLQFALLEEKVSQFAQAINHDERAGPLERWSFALGLFAGGIGSLAGVLLGNRLGLWIAGLALASEIAGFVIGAICMMRREWKTFHRSHEVFSKSLDHDFREYRALVEWVNSYPRDEIARRLRYLRDRKASLVYRSGLYSGGMERYGLLPLIVVLYIQFKDWSFGELGGFGQDTFARWLAPLDASGCLSWRLVAGGAEDSLGHL